MGFWNLLVQEVNILKVVLRHNLKIVLSHFIYNYIPARSFASKMPGNVKLGSSNEPDPDPLPYLAVSMDMKRQDNMKPYDPKKSYWVPDDQGGFLEGLLQSDDGKKAVVMIGHEVGSKD